MKEALRYIIKGIVKHPQEVEIEQTQENGNEVFDLNIHSDDVGQVIGKDGRTIKSINILLNALAGQKEEKFLLRVQR